MISGGRIDARLIAVFHESWKYLLVSVAALAVDYGLLVGLTYGAKLNYQIAAAIGFSAGLIVNYLLSVTLVFSERRLESRLHEFIGFFAIGVIGLGLNALLMKLFVEGAHLSVALAKLPTTGVSFVFNFATRKVLLFTASKRGQGDG